MSNSCILFRKFHFLIGSFDHYVQQEKYQCGTVELHPQINVVQFDVGMLGREGDEIRYIVSLSFHQMRSILYRWYQYTRQ